MTPPDNLVALVLAAGQSRRFAGDKLIAPFVGKPLAAYIADTLVELGIKQRLAVCPAGSNDRAALFEARGFEIVWNEIPENGMGHSLALGATRAQNLRAGALLVCLADMPNIGAAHLRRMIAMAESGDTVATEANGVPMPPALFPGTALPQLVMLSGDRGARNLLAAARRITVEAAVVRDLDTRADFDGSA